MQLIYQHRAKILFTYVLYLVGEFFFTVLLAALSLCTNLRLTLSGCVDHKVDQH